MGNNSQSKPTAPDNNKRLAALEASVSSLAIAMAANGLELGEGEDPIVGATIELKRLGSIDARMTALIAAVTGIVAIHAPNLELAPRSDESLFDLQIRLLEEVAAIEPGQASAGELAAISRADAAEAALTEAKAALATANDEIGELTADVEDMTAAKNAALNKVAELNDVIAAKGYATPAVEPIVEAAPEPRERPEAARDFGPKFDSHGASEIATLIAAGADFEISFSNGEHEIVEIEPVKIDRTALVTVEGRYMVDPPILIRGGQYSEQLDGAALTLGGSQVAYCQFPTAHHIAPGQERQFVRAIVFG